jgi:hypothetical protein
MCFSPEADLVAAVVLAPIGVLTIKAARRPREYALASIPMFFAIHQFIEVFVWLGVQGDVSQGVETFAAVLFIVMAQMVLPILVPVAIGLTEPRRGRRNYMFASAAAGSIITFWFAYLLITGTIEAHPDKHVMVYKTTAGAVAWWGGIVYVNATIFTTLASSSFYLRMFGLANAIGISFAGWYNHEAVTSVWCVYAACISFLLLLHLRNPKTFVPFPGEPGYDQSVAGGSHAKQTATQPA